jgi:hypothetical protein
MLATYETDRQLAWNADRLACAQVDRWKLTGGTVDVEVDVSSTGRAVICQPAPSPSHQDFERHDDVLQQHHSPKKKGLQEEQHGVVEEARGQSGEVTGKLTSATPLLSEEVELTTAAAKKGRMVCELSFAPSAFKKRSAM